MMQTPKSLTATVHIRFHYDETKSKPPSEGEIELLNRLMDQATELEPKLQELLVKFADYIKEISSEEKRAG